MDMHTSPVGHLTAVNYRPLLFVAFILSATAAFNQHLHSENLVKICIRKIVDLEQLTKGVGYHTLFSIMSHHCARYDLETLL